jgi:carboxypeptidase C (cathepsin A)
MPRPRCCLEIAFALALLFGGSPAMAQDDAKPGSETKPGATAKDGKEKDKDKDKDKESAEKLVETKHKLTVGATEIAYTARAGTIFLRDAEEKPTASIFYIAYTRDNVEDLTKRPVTFSFNGGPGSSSVWMHMGLLGPKRVQLEDDGMPLPPPYKLIDNDQSLLDETDLVFIDPVSTGFSRATKPDEAKRFHGVHEDAVSVSEFIRLYVTRNKRWTSPKFIIGESYGTTRAAALSSELAERHKLNVNGIMLVSTVLNFQTILFSDGNDLPYVLFLPSYTATAWYHKKLPAELQGRALPDVLKEAEGFAAGEYQTALLRGGSLSADDHAKAVRQFARLTGLSESYVDRSNLRVNLGRFAKELLAATNRVIGRFDGRYSGFVRDRVANGMEYDPSGSAIMSAYASTFNHYLRTELNYESDLTYEILNGGVNPWNWGESNAYLNVADNLADAITRNPFLKVHVSSGYYDMATPYFGTQYTFNHFGTDPALRANVTLDYYTAGHMMYLNLPDLRKQKADLAKFIRSASGR